MIRENFKEFGRVGPLSKEKALLAQIKKKLTPSELRLIKKAM